MMLIRHVLTAVFLTAGLAIAPALAQTPPAPSPIVPTPAPVIAAPPGALWTLVKHVRFPIVQDQAIAAYPDFNTCQNEAFIYTAQFKQWWTTYACELRANTGLGLGVFPRPIVAPPRVIPRPVFVPPRIVPHPLPRPRVLPHHRPHVIRHLPPHHFRGKHGHTHH